MKGESYGYYVLLFHNRYRVSYRFIDPVNHSSRKGKMMPDINQELRYQRFIIREDGIDTLSFWYYLTPYKCCGCYPKFQHQWVGMYNTKEYLRCENCGRQTEPVEDYSWQKTTKAWDEMMKGVYDEHHSHFRNGTITFNE